MPVVDTKDLAAFQQRVEDLALMQADELGGAARQLLEKLLLVGCPEPRHDRGGRDQLGDVHRSPCRHAPRLPFGSTQPIFPSGRR